MQKYDSVIIGHVTQDINTDSTGKTEYMAGGAVLYSSASAYALGHKVLAVTKAANDGRDRIDAFTLPGEDVLCLPSKTSTDMVNIYHTPDKERRTSRCTERGEAFTADDIPSGTAAKIFHLAGLLYGDYADGMIEALSKRGAVAVDVQGYLRHAGDDGAMYFADWTDKKKLLPYITYLKTDAAEAEILTGLTDRREAARLLHAWGAKEILITHNTEVLVFDGETFFTCPIRARNFSGRTGRGDTTFAAYINERLQSNIADALLLATATVSLKMESPGVFKGNRNDVYKYIEEFYND